MDFRQVPEPVVPQPKPPTLEQGIRSYIQILQELLVELEAFKTEAEQLQKDCLIANTVGVSTAGVGSCVLLAGWITSLCLAIPTAGVSLVIAGGLTIGGSVAAAAGGLTSAGTGIAKHVKTKSMIDKVVAIQERQLVNAEQLGKLTKVMDAMSKKLEKKYGISKKRALPLLLRALRSGRINLSRYDVMTQLNEVLAAIDDKKEDLFVGETTKLMADSASIVINALSPFSLLLDDIVLAMGRGTAFSVGGTVAAMTLKGVFAIGGGVISGFEIYRLVRNWLETDPLVEQIQEIISLYEEELRKMNELLKVYLTIPGI